MKKNLFKLQKSQLLSNKAALQLLMSNIDVFRLTLFMHHRIESEACLTWKEEYNYNGFCKSTLLAVANTLLKWHVPRIYRKHRYLYGQSVVLYMHIYVAAIYARWFNINRILRILAVTFMSKKWLFAFFTAS